MRLRRSSSRMRDSGRHLKSLRQPRLRRPTSSRPRARATCPAPQPDGSRPCMCAFSAMLEAVRTVRAPLAKFYALLNDEQKARFNALPSGEDQNEPGRRRNLSVLCSERASGISSVPIRRMELAVRPDEVQRASLRALEDAIAQAGELLNTESLKL